MSTARLLMQGFLLCFFIFFLGDRSSAQNWNPINSFEKFSYANTADGPLVQSVKEMDYSVDLNNDTTYHLNKIYKACPDCEGLEFCDGEPWLRNQQVFLADSFKVQEGLWSFFGDYPFDLIPTAGVGESWLFNQDDLSIALVDSVVTATILGEEDQLKYISIDNWSDPIVLSENHGLVSFTDPIDNSHYELCGISDRGLGNYELTFEEAFDFEVGDVFIYSASQNDEATIKCHLIRREIESVETYQDSVIVGFSETMFTRTNFFGQATGLQSSSSEHEVTYRKSEVWPENAFIHGESGNELANVDLDLLESYYFISSSGSQHRTDDSNELKSLYTGRLHDLDIADYCEFPVYPLSDDELFYSSSNDIMCRLNDPESFVFSESRSLYSFQQGLGYTQLLELQPLYPEMFRMIGYLKYNGGQNSDPVGLYFEEEEVLALGIDEKDTYELDLHYNATEGRLTIGPFENFKMAGFQIYNSSGQLVKQGKFAQSINISELAKGLYLFVVQLNDHNLVHRFLKN